MKKPMFIMVSLLFVLCIIYNYTNMDRVEEILQRLLLKLLLRPPVPLRIPLRVYRALLRTLLKVLLRTQLRILFQVRERANLQERVVYLISLEMRRLRSL